MVRSNEHLPTQIRQQINIYLLNGGIMNINYEAVGRFAEAQEKIRNHRAGVRDMWARMHDALLTIDSYATESRSMGVSLEGVEAFKGDLDSLLFHVTEIGKLEAITRELADAEPYILRLPK